MFYIPNTLGQECEVDVQSNADNFNWDSAQFYALNLDVLSKCSDIANAGKIDNLSVSNGRVSLCVDADGNDRLFISVPSDEDWDITVNGGEAETELIGDCLYSIKLTQGTNDITMTYHIRYLTLGIVITTLTLILCVSYFCVKKD